jgi:nucleotide-binding universal stress UspA family protein
MHGWQVHAGAVNLRSDSSGEELVSDWLVCGIDDSRGAREAARCAKAMADRLAAGLMLVHVACLPVVPGASGVPHAGQELRECTVMEARSLLVRVAAETDCLEAEQRVELGEPVQRLVGVAEEREALMLVIGSRGRGALRAALLGSVSLRLCRQAHCPVLVIPPGAAVSGASV